MTTVEQFLLGLTITFAGATLAYLLLWYREVRRHEYTRKSRDSLRALLHEAAKQGQPLTEAGTQRRALADALLIAQATPRIRLADEQQAVRSLADANQQALQRDYK